MNGKQIIILIVALAVSSLILWHDLPIAFPLFIYKVLMLFLKLFSVLVLTVVAYAVVSGKKRDSSEKSE